jgi:hypothetical protein
LHDEILRMLHELREKSGRARGAERRSEAESPVTRRNKKETSAKQTEQLVEVVGKKVKEAVKETITSLKEKDHSNGS